MSNISFIFNKDDILKNANIKKYLNTIISI